MAETNRFQMDEPQVSTLLSYDPAPEIEKACNVDARDHVHLARVGEKGSGLAARGLLTLHEGSSAARVFLAAPELRQLASALLNVADAIDGKTPLVFFDPSAPETDEPER
jgi:hypothetical protein